ncbi:MAG: response regulator [Firmicutes bacterium]|nr:response regulator [Bacillota bacterium]
MVKTIFSVDDNDTNLIKIEDALGEHYNVITLSSGASMFKLIEKITPDLILLDIRMPEMDGFEAMEKLKSRKEYQSIPVIFLTATNDTDVETQGFKLGAVDFINKPFSDAVLLNRVQLHLNLNGLIRERTAQLERAYHSLIFVLSDLVENRDENTGGHIERTVEYIKLLVYEMIAQKIYYDELILWDMEVVPPCAMLHDIGKINVSDTILNKPDKLTESEYDIMKTHVIMGANIIDKVIERTGEDMFLKTAKLFAEFHHENWDGSGYPHGLKGENIPIHGRLMAIADVYDALVTERPYKEAFTHEAAVDIIMSESGKRFDPLIVKTFYNIQAKFDELHKAQPQKGHYFQIRS